MKLAVIPGDGIGPEVVAEGLKVLQGVVPGVAITEYDLGAAAGTAPASCSRTRCCGSCATTTRSCSAPSVTRRCRPASSSAACCCGSRFELDHHVNLRPARLYPGVPGPLAGDKAIDLVVLREGTEGPYAGNGGLLRKDTPHEIATEVSHQHLLRRRAGGPGRVRAGGAACRASTSPWCTRRTSSRTPGSCGAGWSRRCRWSTRTSPSPTRHVDAAMIYLVTDPGRFDVVVTDNLFGDIFTDLAAAVSGGIGLAASGNLDVSRTNPSMFEPVHGSAPDIAGTGHGRPDRHRAVHRAAARPPRPAGGRPPGGGRRRVRPGHPADRAPSAAPGHRRPAGGAGIELIEHRADRDELSHVMSAASAVPPRHAAGAGPSHVAAGRRVPRLRHHPARRRPARGHHLLGRRQARRRHAARRTRRRLHRGRLARRDAQGHRVLRRATSGELRLRTASLVAFGATRKAGVRAQDDPQVRALLDSGAPVITLVAKSDVRHVERALRTTLEENLAMVADTVRLPGGQRAPGVPRLRALLRRVRGRPRLRRAGRGGGGHRRRRRRRAVRHQRRHAADGRSSGSSERSATAPASGSASTARTTPAARSRTPWPRSQAGATHVQCTANGYGERAGNADLFAVVGNLMTKMGLPVLPDGALADMMRVSHALAELANIAPEHPSGLRRLVGVLAQGRSARLGDQGRPGAVQPPRPDPGRQRHAHPDHRDGRPGLGRAQGARARRRPGRPPGGRRPDRRRRQGAGGRSAGRTRPPTPPSSCSSATSSPADGPRRRESPQGVPARVLPGDRREQPRHQRGDFGGDGQGARRRPADHRHRGGQRAGERAGLRAAHARSPSTSREFSQVELVDYKVRILAGIGRHRLDHQGAGLVRARGRRSGRRSACTPTSSRPPGRRWSTRWSTRCGPAAGARHRGLPARPAAGAPD